IITNYSIIINILKHLITNSLEIFRQINIIIASFEKKGYSRRKRANTFKLVATKETLLVIILLTSRGKSLIFIVPAILSRSRVTIVVAPYAELKRQLVTRYTNAGLDYK
ncbi:hypothetical protein F5882DRAFT_262031, partial [Hyaloscypha sp. PMI_1271]